MILSRKWLNDYVKIDATDKEYSDALTISGSKVEGFEKEGAELSNIVVGKVLSLERHPDSDHLWICSIDVGKEEKLQIVTGAQNLKENDIVPVALDNSVVHGGHKIKKGKLRGVESNGMLCSLGELGLTLHDFPYAVDDGIFVLGDDCDKTLGLDIHEAIGLNDTAVEFEITSNRPDCMSVLGLARETAATFDVDFDYKAPVVKEDHGDVNEQINVQIHDPSLCYRYIGAVVENVRVKESPRWMRERLRASGVRPINNFVDITNYVMLEYGQPMHAFDFRLLEGNTINVRHAQNGEKITTLDGVERDLNENVLVIADEKKPIAIAGVMGGEYSGIMDDTKTVVFESACFNGANVRTTAKSFGMRTEASSRYEKELDPSNCLPAIQRALELVQLLDAGDVVNGLVDCDKSVKKEVVLDFDVDWINKFIGIDLSADEMKKILEKIDFKVENGKVYAPSFRGDIEHLADISEEIARFYGYQNIPNRELKGVANGKMTPMQSFRRKIDDTLIACGASEIATYSFFSPKAYDRIMLPADSALRNSVVISNPLGEDTSIMRTTALPSMLDVLARNYNNRNAEACLFERATIYIPTDEELPIEKQNVIIGMYGAEYDFYSLKGIVEELCTKLGIDNYDVEVVSDNPTFHPGRCAKFVVDGKELAILGEIHPAVNENYGINTRVYAAQIDVNTAFDYRTDTRTYKALPRFPASSRDLAIVCDKDMPVLKIEKTIAEAVGKTLETIKLFDVYEGEQIEKGKKSVAFSIRMRSSERTLTDEEADAAIKRAVKALDKIGISMRS